MKELSITQSWLASALEIRQSTLSNWLNDKGEPGVTDLIRINHIFGISIDFLIMEDLKKGNLIETLKKNWDVEKGKVKGKLIGKPIGSKGPLYPVRNTNENESDRGGESGFWLVAEKLSKMDEKIDQIKDLMKKGLKT